VSETLILSDEIVEQKIAELNRTFEEIRDLQDLDRAFAEAFQAVDALEEEYDRTIRLLTEARAELRRLRSFDLADRIRDHLNSIGHPVRDRPVEG
jgi:cysteinyl-tRNA synthetase